MIETEIRSKYQSGLLQILKICCQKLFGFVPDTLRFEFKPLKMLDTVDDSEMKTQALNRVIAAFQNGLIPADDAISQLNKEKVFALNLDAATAMSLEEVQDLRQGDDAPVVPTLAYGTKVIQP
jgi:hypothetical protein